MAGEASPQRYQVLALNGGGAKALFTAHVLARLEEDLGVKIVDSFDLITGTSAGAIIALALGAGMTPAEIASSYTTVVEKVFAPQANLVASFFVPKYQLRNLRDALQDVFASSRFGASVRPMVIPTWDVQRGKVYLFKTPHHAMYRRDWKLRNVEVALASAAAPTYFGAARIGGQRFIDGGVWANNPSVVGIAEAVGVLGVPLESVALLNIGTTVEPNPHPRRLDRGGLAAWAPKVVPLILAANNRGGEALASNLLGPRYVRFDAQVPAGAFKLDRIDRFELEGYAASASRGLTAAYETSFASHRAADYKPLYLPE